MVHKMEGISESWDEWLWKSKKRAKDSLFYAHIVVVQFNDVDLNKTNKP